ncbi:MAG: YlbF family regulator [Bacillota bacterium]
MKKALRESAQRLGQALRLTPEMAAYEAALADYQGNAALMTQVRRYQTVRREFEQAQYRGGLTQHLLDELRQLQTEINGHPAVIRIVDAQEAIKGPAQQANEVIREILRIDFAANAGGGGCCG